MSYELLPAGIVAVTSPVRWNPRSLVDVLFQVRWMQHAEVDVALKLFGMLGAAELPCPDDGVITMSAQTRTMSSGLTRFDVTIE